MVDAGAALGVARASCGAGAAPVAVVRRSEPSFHVSAKTLRQAIHAIGAPRLRRPRRTPARRETADRRRHFQDGHFLYPLPTDTTSLVQTRTRHASTAQGSVRPSDGGGRRRRLRRRLHHRRGRRRVEGLVGGGDAGDGVGREGGEQRVDGGVELGLVRRLQRDDREDAVVGAVARVRAEVDGLVGGDDLVERCDEGELLDAEEELALGGGRGAAEEVLADDAELWREGQGRDKERERGGEETYIAILGSI